MSAAVLAAAIALTPMSAVTAAAEVPQTLHSFQHCVAQRESHGNYLAKGDQSSARGKYQFLDRAWRHGLSFMVAARLVKFGMSSANAHKIRVHLQSISIDRWEPMLQEIAFAAVVSASPRGWRHWYITGSKCNALAGKR